MTISPFPTPTPSRSQDQDTFDAAVEAFLTQFPTFVSEANALAVAMNLNSTTDTSVTSNTIGTGAKTFTVSSGKSFQPGMWLVIADTAAPTTNAMFAQVTSYSGTTLMVNSYAIMGSGTKTAWIISQSAPAALDGLYARHDAVSLLVSVASAATIDVFGAAAATIDLTGTTTVTGLTACTSGQVGSAKRVIPSNAAGVSFTASANMIVDGATSGTYLMPQDAIVEVLATSTTTFKVRTVYAKMSFTPYYELGTPGTSSFGTYPTQIGTAIKIGNRVTCDVFVIGGVFSLGTGSGNLSVKGFPWTANATIAGGGIVNFSSAYVTLAPIQVRFAASTAEVSFRNTSGATVSAITSAHCASSLRTEFTVEYFV